MSKTAEIINKQVAKGIEVFPYEDDFSRLPDDFPPHYYWNTFPSLPEEDSYNWLHDNNISIPKKLEPLKPLLPLKTYKQLLEELTVEKEKVKILEKQIQFTNTTLLTSVNADIENLYSKTSTTKEKKIKDGHYSRVTNSITALEARTIADQPERSLINIYEDINNSAQLGGTKITWRTENLSGDCVYKVIHTLRANGFKCTYDAFDPFIIIISW